MLKLKCNDYKVEVERTGPYIGLLTITDKGVKKLTKEIFVPFDPNFELKIKCSYSD